MAACESKTPSRWRIGGASVVGTSHIRTDTPCQDAHAYAVLPDGSLVIAVADGAGSAERSREGAQIAVEAAVASLTQAPAPHQDQDETALLAAMHDAFRAGREAIARHAEEAREPIRSFATTLTCVLATECTVVVGQIGDGAVVTEDDENAFSTAILPLQGEYAGETYFLTMEEMPTRLEVAIVPAPIRAVAVMTDGLVRLSLRLPAHDPHPPFFLPRIDIVRDAPDSSSAEQYLWDFLASERVCARTDDDKTLVVAVAEMIRDPSTGGEAAEAGR